MENLCRFCLKVATENMLNLQDCDLIYRFQICLRITLLTVCSFPSKLCKECYKKISLITKFYDTVADTEAKLRHYFKKGRLQDYYDKIRNNEINDEQKVSKEKKTHEKVKDDTNTDYRKDDHLTHEGLPGGNNRAHCSSDQEITLSSIRKQKEIFTTAPLKKITIFRPLQKESKKKRKEKKTNEKVENDINTDIGNDDHLINEELPDNNTKAHCSSANEITLSSIRKNKEIFTTAPLKKITIFRPLQILINSKRKNKKEPENIECIKPFTCLTCMNELNSQADLTKHYYAEHYRKKTTGDKYTVHKSEDKTMYSCDSCEKTFTLKKDIVKHVKSHTDNRDERPLICKLCARTYRTVPEIVRHARAHNGFKLECPYNCGYTTAYQGAMKEHKNRHLDEYKYTCKTCGKGFNIKTWYEQHQNLHTGAKPFICNLCDVAFPLSRYLQTHKSSMHPQSSSLKRYRCVHCDEMCDSSKSLATHLQQHGISKATDFLCDFCGKMLRTAYQLEYHHRMHLGIKPYSCTICKKKFAKKYNVQLHMNIHTGDKAYYCSHCGRRYSQKCALLKHLKSFIQFAYYAPTRRRQMTSIFKIRIENQ